MPKLNFVPVNVSVVVRENLPTSVAGLVNTRRTIMLRQYTCSVASYLDSEFGHTVLQDRFGEIWSQKTDNMIVPLGGRHIDVKDSDYELDLDWRNTIVFKVRGLSRRTMAPKVPYHIGVLAIYEGCTPSRLPRARIPANLTARERPINARTAFRAWFADELTTHYVMRPSEVVHLAKRCFITIPFTDLANIAAMYNHSRDNLTAGNISLSEFVNRELKKYGHTKSPIGMLEDSGASLAGFEQRIATV